MGRVHDIAGEARDPGPDQEADGARFSQAGRRRDPSRLSHRPARPLTFVHPPRARRSATVPICGLFLARLPDAFATKVSTIPWCDIHRAHRVRAFNPEAATTRDTCFRGI